MFTRVVEVTTKNGKAKEVSKIVQEKILPILRNQNGFVDEITLISTSNPNRILALSFWQSREDAQQYQAQQFQTVNNLIRSQLETDPKIETYDLENSTMHKIASGKAA